MSRAEQTKGWGALLRERGWAGGEAFSLATDRKAPVKAREAEESDVRGWRSEQMPKFKHGMESIPGRESIPDGGLTSQ